MLCSPSALTIVAAGHVATCDSPSAHVKLTVTLVLFHPPPFAGGEALPEIVGAVLSMLMVAAAEAWFPALSDTVRVTVCPAPSVVSVTAAGQASTPESASLHAKPTVTPVLFQPFAFAAGASVWVTVGAMLSHFRATALAVSALPDLSTDQ
jgi:hypothetical protein